MLINLFKCFVVLFFAFVIGQLLLNLNLTYLAAAILLIVFPIFILRPHLYFIAFILFRPIIDMTIQRGGTDSNLSALTVIPLIALCFKDILFNESYIRKILSSSFLKRFNMFFLIFIIISLVSMVNTNELKTSMADFLRLISLMISVNYAIVYFGQEKEGLKKFTKYVLLSSLIPIGFGLYQFWTNTGMHEQGLNRVYGTFAHSNVFAEYLFLLLFLLMFYISRPENKYFKEKFILLGFLALTAFCFYGTFTRTLWIAFGIACFFYVFMKRRVLQKILYSAVMACLVLVLFSKLEERFDFNTSVHQGRSSWEWRLDTWRDLVVDIKKHPLIGHGLGMFEHDLNVMAHNDFLRLSYETGLPGAIVFYGFLFYLLFYTFKRSVFTKRIYEKEKFNLAFCLTLGLLIASMGVNTLRSTIIMFYFLIAIALLAQERENYENSFSQ
jgi:O-antigen ligase